MKLDYNFVKISGVWVPKSHHYERTTKDGSSYRRTMEWIENAANEPTDPNLFSIAKLGLSDGDRVTDNIGGSEYTFFNSTEDATSNH